jgi:hypothetical protein
MELIMARAAAQHFSNRAAQSSARAPHSAALAGFADSVRAIGWPS